LSELELLLRIARDHKTCRTEEPRIEGDAVLIPFDVYKPNQDPSWSIEYEVVRDRGELLEALGYG
jgi:hypothetical protein